MTDTAAFTLSLTGHAITWSPVVREAFGWEAGEFIGKHFGELFAVPDGGDSGHAIGVARVEGIAPLAGWRIGKSGRRSMVRGSVSLLHGEAGEPTGFAVVMDLIPAAEPSDRLAPLAVEEARDLVAGVVESMPDAFYVLDDEFRYVYANAVCELLWGVDREELIGRSVIDAFPQLQDSEFWFRQLKAARSVRSLRYESYSPLRGRTVEVLAQPVEGGVAVLVRDPFEYATIDDKDRVGVPQSALEVAVSRYLPASGALVPVGAQTDVFGLDPGQEIESLTDKVAVLLAADRKAYEHAVEAAVANGEPWHFEYRVKRPRDGETAWLAEHGTPDTASGELAYVVMTWDITAVRRVEQQLRTGQRRLRRELLVNRTVHDVLARSTATEDPRAGVEELVDAAIGIVGGKRGGVWMLDRQTGRLRVYAQQGFGGGYLVEFGDVDADVAALDTAEENGVAVTRVPADQVAALTEDEVDAAEDRAMRTTLRGADGRVVGVLCIHVDADRHPNERDHYALKVISMQAAAMLDRIQVEEQSNLLVKRLEEHARVAGDALLESEVRFRRAFELGPVAAVITTRDEDRFLEVNDGYLKLTGYDREEVIGRTARELGMWSSPEDRQKLDAALSSDGPFRELQLRLRTRDGQVREILLSGEEIDYAGNRCMLKMFNDVTEQHRSQEELMTAIREVMSDTEWFGKSVVQRLAEIRQGGPVGLDDHDLTPREVEVLEYVAAGLSDEEVADRLGISQRTARNHLTNTYGKIGAHNRAEAIVWARERGLVARLN